MGTDSKTINMMLLLIASTFIFLVGSQDAIDGIDGGPPTELPLDGRDPGNDSRLFGFDPFPSVVPGPIPASTEDVNDSTNFSEEVFPIQVPNSMPEDLNLDIEEIQTEEDLESMGFFEEPLTPDELASITEECPVVPIRDEKECEGAIHTCWSLGQADVDCIDKGNFCCFDGCTNRCLDEICPSKNVTTFVFVEEEQCEDVLVQSCINSATQSCEEKCKADSKIETINEPTKHCTTITVPECNNVTVQECNDVLVPVVKPVPVCQNVTVQTCNTVVEPECYVQPNFICLNATIHPDNTPFCQSVSENVCTTQPISICINQTTTISTPVQNCSEVTFQDCMKPLDSCHEVPSTNCEIKPVPSTETKKVKTCTIKFVKICQNVLVNSCEGSQHNSYVPYECHQTPEEVCKIVPRKYCRYEYVQVQIIKDEEVCEEIITVQCIDEPVCTNVTNIQCSTTYNFVDEVEEVCKNSTTQVCSDVVTEKCDDKTINTESDNKDCIESPIEVCHDIVSVECIDVTRPECLPKNVTTNEVQTQCEDVVVQNCHGVETESCHSVDVPTNVCECTDVPSISCEIHPQKNCTTVMVSKPITQLVSTCE